MSDNKDKFNRDVRRILNESLEDFDGATLSRLNQARHRALAARSGRKTRLVLWGSIPAAGLVVLLLLLFQPLAPIPRVTEPDLSDLQIMTATESLDFYQEDMEFYEWMTEVLENDKELSGDDRSQPVVVSVGPFASTADRRAGSAGARIDRISRHI